MNQELTVTHTQELQIARQEAEILKLKFELQKVQAEKSSRLEDSLFSPALFPHYQKVAETLAKSGVIPTSYRGKPEDVFVAMAMGYQLGFPVEQSLQDIAVINGRPCLWGDGLLSLVLNHADCQDIKEEPIYNGDLVVGYICTVLRKGHNSHSKSFTLKDAERAGLLRKGDAWIKYPERMMQMRARSLALRDKFADALRGLRVAEVERDDDEGTIIDAEIVTDKHESQVDKLKKIIESNSAPAPAPIQEQEKQKESQNKAKTHNTGSDNEPISQEQIDEIQLLFVDKSFSDERIKKSLDYYKVDELSQLTNAQAVVFLLQLGKA